MSRAARAVLAVGAALVALAACSSPEQTAPDPSGVRGSITVFAAASLTGVFGAIADEFTAAHPGTTVTFNFAGSSTLAAQLDQGAPADVFAAASPATMATVTQAGHAAGEPVVFARNQLVIAVAKGNPLGIAGLTDLTRPGVAVALCAPQVPCGAAATTAIDTAGIAITPVSFEENVRAALSKVALGEVDAALVYRTDTAGTDEVDAVEFPESAAAVNDYLIAVLREAPNPAGGQAFVAFVQSPAAAALLRQHGFQQP